jgi:REP element-mobilizing transposase RayT
MSDLPTIRQRKRLPHWEAPNSIYFVTFRFADSLPASVIQQIRADRRTALEKARRGRQPFSLAEQKRIRRLFSRRIEDYLDKGSCSCRLANPALAENVAGALRHFDGVRYRLFAWCVMPNHVHVVFQPHAGFALAEIVHSWKSFSAHRINKASTIRGTIWQREYYDHLIRDGDQFVRAVRYVAENPERAGLKDWKWVEVCKRD